MYPNCYIIEPKKSTMNKEHHIKELEMRIEHIRKEPVKGWLGRISKSMKVRKIEKKIMSLKKGR